MAEPHVAAARSDPEAQASDRTLAGADGRLPIDAADPEHDDGAVAADAAGALATGTADAVSLGGLAAALEAVASGMGPTGRGLACFLAALWSRALCFEASDPEWPDRDRFVVSDGALSPIFYALLHLTGFDGMGREVLDRFGRLGSATAPFPLPAQHPAIEAAAGLPGQGLAAGVGMALGERLMAARFGRSLVDHRTWVLASAGDLAAGLGQEVASLAGGLRLERLTVIFEEPPFGAGRGADGLGRDKDEVELLRRFSACGWTVRSVDGEDEAAVLSCLAATLRARRATLIALRPSSQVTRRDVPDDAALGQAVRSAWRVAGLRGGAARRGWLKRLARHGRRAEFERALTGRLPPSWHAELQSAAPAGTAVRSDKESDRGFDSGAETGSVPAAAGPTEATLRGLDAVLQTGRSLVFLSSTRTAALFAHLPPIGPGAFDGRHLACGAQEHGMATLANGLSLHGGLLPVLAAPAIAADRIRPALRMAALMGRKAVLLLTDDGLSAASEGAAFQPVEQLAAMRAMPGLFVFRPSCGVEALECLELALRRPDGPSVIALTHDLVASGRVPGEANRAIRGAHVLAEGARRDVTLLASGAEVGLALDARAALAGEEIEAAVVSLPCWELFARQDQDWRDAVLGQAPRLGLEAAGGFGWERWLGEDGRFIGLDGFGASGRVDELRTHLGLTADAVASAARDAVRARAERAARRAGDGRDRPGAHHAGPTG